jgi:hypothetical protein
MHSRLASRSFRTFFDVSAVGWVGSNPRPADCAKHGLTPRLRCLHGYHGVAPPVTLIAPIARVSRSTNRSTAKR